MTKDDAINLMNRLDEVLRATPGIGGDPSPADVARVYMAIRAAGADHEEAIRSTIASFNRYQNRIR